MHTPSKLSVHLFTTGVGERFERDTEYSLGSRIIRVKHISDGRDNRLGVRRQGTYIERVR